MNHEHSLSRSLIVFLHQQDHEHCLSICPGSLSLCSFVCVCVVVGGGLYQSATIADHALCIHDVRRVISVSGTDG